MQRITSDRYERKLWDSKSNLWIIYNETQIIKDERIYFRFSKYIVE